MGALTATRTPGSKEKYSIRSAGIGSGNTEQEFKNKKAQQNTVTLFTTLFQVGKD
ncbi:MAG: hypothetical protein ACYC09_12270 [Bacteroidota bacterium]